MITRIKEYKLMMESSQTIPDTIQTDSGDTLIKSMETPDFVYYTHEDDETVHMYRKQPWELVSNNYMAEDDYFDHLIKRDWTWISDIGLYAADELAKQSNN
jgi:hypothetical protein